VARELGKKEAIAKIYNSWSMAFSFDGEGKTSGTSIRNYNMLIINRIMKSQL
jgi:hypothetical protein